MAIEKQFYIRVDYEPVTYPNRRQDGSYLIKYYDEVESELAEIDSRVCMMSGTPCSSPYVECTVDSMAVAKHIDKAIQAKLTKYGYRVL